MFFILLHKYFKTSIIGIKERLKFLIIGISFPILIGIPTGVILPAYGIKLFPHNNILTTFTCLFIGYGIMKYKFLSIKPLHEEGKLKINNKELQKFSLDYTNQYLVCTKNPVESSYNILIDKLSKKNYGLIITTQKPDDIRKQYNLKTTPIIWLTDLETDELSIGPNDIRQLQATIDNFTKSIPQSFVLLDGLDYLIKKNSFSKILFFVKSVKISIHCHKSIFIIPSEKYDLTQKQETMLTYEYRILPSKSARFIRLAELKRFISKKAKFIALGYDSAIESLAKEIKYQKSNITIISPNIKDKKEKHIQYIEDNPLKKQSLEKYIKDSNNYVVFVSLVNDSDTMLAINLIRSITEKAQIIANIHRTSFISIAERAGSDYVVASSTLGGHLLALSVHNPNTIRWIMEAVTRFGKGIQLKEMNISSKYVNKTVHQVDKIFGTKANIIAIRSGDYFEQIPADDYKIRKGDVLLLVHAE